MMMMHDKSVNSVFWYWLAQVD